MNSDEQTKTSHQTSSFVRIVTVATSIFLSLAIVNLWALITFIPRRDEGIRSVPAIEWRMYVLLGDFVPLILALTVLTFVFRSRRERVLSWLIAAIVCFLAHGVFVSDILYRDFIGKL